MCRSSEPRIQAHTFRFRGGERLGARGRAVRSRPARVGALALLAAACSAEPRLHSASELSALADRCGVFPTDFVQDHERPRFFYYLKPAAGEAQFRCVSRWAKRNRLNLVFVETVERAPATSEP